MNKFIEDGYVSYEIAELLKEKGFDIPVHTFYNPKKSCFLLKLDPALINRNAGVQISAPSHQMVMKWLREVHKWSIQVFPVFDNLKWSYDIYELKIQKYQSRPELLSDVDYDTYEEAVEAAIKYCLINLIK